MEKSTALNNTINDSREEKESDISSFTNDSESKFVQDNHATDSSSTFQTYSGEK